jgi:hypothetical protein
MKDVFLIQSEVISREYFVFRDNGEEILIILLDNSYSCDAVLTNKEKRAVKKILKQKINERKNQEV